MPSEPTFALDPLDHRLVEALRQDGRRSNVDLARDLQVSEKTVRNRLKRLREQGGLRISAQFEAPTGAVQVIFLVGAAPGRRFTLGERLLEHPEVSQVLLSNGAADLIVYASFDDDDRALRFLVDSIESAPDVRESSACSIISRVGPVEVSRPDARIPEITMDDLVDAMLHPPEFDDLQPVIDWICATTIRCFSADHAACIIYDPNRHPRSRERRQIHAQATIGLAPGYLGAMAERLRRSGVQGVVQHAFNTRQHVFVDDVITSPLMRGTEDLIRSEGYTSMIVFPILFGAMPVGACMLYFDHRITVDELFLGAAQKFVDQCAVTVARVEPAVVEVFGAELIERASRMPHPGISTD